MSVQPINNPNNITAALKNDIAHSGGDMVLTAGGDLGQVAGLANLKLALFHRLITVPGTLIHRPTYGVGIGSYQNAPATFTLQAKLAGLIQDQFAQDPRVQSIQSVGLDVPDDKPSFTTITVFLTPVGYTEQKMVFDPFNGGDTGQ